MKKITTLLFVLLFVTLQAQQSNVEVLRGQTAAPAGRINLNDPNLQDWEPYIHRIAEQPDGQKVTGSEKDIANLRRAQHQPNTNNLTTGSRSTTPAPVLSNNFAANNAQGTPNDNHIAISNEGKIVSVVNTNFRVYNEAGTMLQSKTLSTFAAALGTLASISDPRVIYDPIADRFIVIFFAGNTSLNSRIIVAFSETNDPAAQWNLYALNGNYRNDTSWSDYPIVMISDKDLFMTFNHLKDGFDWKSGFRYSAIWQIDKSRGYTGDTLQFNYWHNIVHNGKAIWNVCPISYGSVPSGPETYFVSVRPSDLSNDTVFLHTITNSYQSGNAQFSTKVLTTNLPYGIAPNAKQIDGQYLATNDARVLDGFFENNKIQYVQNTVDPNTMTAAVYVGEINNPTTATPTVTGQYISIDTIDLGYPSITYMGNNNFDNRAIITCSFSAPDTFPGTCAFYKDADGNISDMLIVKKGDRAVDVLGDTVERWGDYTGIQRKYNEPNVAWLAGSYGGPGESYRTWIARVVNPDSSVVSSVKSPETNTPVSVFPNPASEKFEVKIELPQNNFTRFEVYNAEGKLVRTLMENYCKPGTNLFSFNSQYLINGTYFLRITNRGQLLKTEKIIISR